ncbi:MAG: hypothetical protein M3444_00605 [Acidobacteriota bacterium]|nr:hypothetical protein [Acidobacteriota bacterium]MDQ5836197.1 hypothetical protein [Acidobacteriota bacterium]
MDEESRSGTAEPGRRCPWCGTLLGEEEARRARRPACNRCARLLAGAGLSDAQIFGPHPEVPEDPAEGD